MSSDGVVSYSLYPIVEGYHTRYTVCVCVHGLDGATMPDEEGSLWHHVPSSVPWKPKRNGEDVIPSYPCGNIYFVSVYVIYICIYMYIYVHMITFAQLSID